MYNILQKAHQLEVYSLLNYQGEHIHVTPPASRNRVLPVFWYPPS